MKITAIILLAGKSSRFGANTPKQFYEVNGKPLAFYSIGNFESSILIDDIVLVTRKDYVQELKNIVKQYKFKKVRKIVVGGETRQQSVCNGLNAVNPSTDIVVIHDGARPIVAHELLARCIEGAGNYGAATAAIPCVDTTVTSNDGIYMDEKLDRSKLWSVQTPQCFEFSLIKKAHKETKEKDASDDAQLVKGIGHDVALIAGLRSNIKVTTQEELPVIEALIEKVY